jgi:hypothetical protein
MTAGRRRLPVTTKVIWVLNMALDRLAPELLRLIQSQLDSPKDLYSFIAASPACFRTFITAREIILSSVIKNTLLPGAVYHALFLLRVPKPRPGSMLPAVKEVEAFLGQYFRADSLDFPIDLPSIVSLSRLVTMVSRLTNKFLTMASKALQISSKAHGNGDAWSLSSTEMTRLQRAFLRFEIYCQIFPPDRSAASRSLLPADAQYNWFLGKMEPCEIEEIACIHQWFVSMIHGYLEDHVDQFIHAVLQIPGLRIPSQYNLQPCSSTLMVERHEADRQEKAAATSSNSMPSSSKSQQDEEDFDEYFTDGEDGDEGLTTLTALDLTDLDLFSKDCRWRFPSIVGYMASLGLRFLDKLILADNHERRQLIRRNAPRSREFLPEALEHAPRNDHGAVLLPGAFLDGSFRPNPDSLDFKWPDRDYYLNIVRNGFSHESLRECGYIFWDSTTVLRPAIREALREAERRDRRSISSLLHGAEGESAEERLKGFQLPRFEKKKLIKEFGSK